MISGDPVGETADLAELVGQTILFAEERSLRIAALGVSSTGRELFEQAGLRSLYLGDEAIVDTAAFSLDGRAVRKVRQSVTRLEKAGYRARLAELGSLDPERARTSSRRSPRTGAAAPPSAASAWRWTRFATRTAGGRWCSSPSARTGRSAASSSSCRRYGRDASRSR